MKTLDEVLGLLESRMDRSTVEDYIAREWVRPERQEERWNFEEIDIARLKLIRHLMDDMEVNESGMDVVLSLLDQLYAARNHMQRLSDALAHQPSAIQAEIKAIVMRLAARDTTQS